MDSIKAELFRLAQHGDLEALKSLVQSNFGNGDKSWLDLFNNKSGDTILHLAVRHGHLNVLHWLTETHGADLEQANLDAKRPLHEAAQNTQLNCLSYLLEKCVSVDPLKKADWTPLMLACTKVNIEVIRTLIDAGANPELRNKDGWNSFHIACREGSREIVSFLLDSNPSIWNTVSKNWRTPLHTAALHGCLAVTEVLLQRGNYAPDMKDSCGTTPLMDALRAGFIDLAKLLIGTQKANVEIEDNMGRQALHLSAQAGCEASVHFLTEEMSVDVNVQSSVSGVTALHVATKEGQDDMLRLLIKLGSDIYLVDTKGRTALHIACGNQFLSSVKVLMENGAKDSKDNSGNYASSLAVKQEIRDIMESYR